MYCNSVDQIPKNEHYVIITTTWFTTKDYDGRDETSHALQYETFIDKAKWEEKIRLYAERKEKFYAGVMRSAKVTTVHHISIE